MRFLAFAISLAAICGCSEKRAASSTPTWDAQVSQVMAARCTECHGANAKGWRATSYLDAIACTQAGAAAVLPPDDAAPMLRALADATHANVASAEERDAIARWVKSGVPKLTRGVHDPSFVDPRSPAFHGAALRARQWKPMIDPNDPEACARCHDGTPGPRPEKITTPAPGATACTSCHTEPAGALACATCHGDGARAYPPRDPCFFPDDAAGAHPKHAGATATHAIGLPCESCHPAPDPKNVLAGAHANGIVDVLPALAYDGTCTTTCHARPGGTRPKPAWTDKGPLACNACHGSPPPNHYAGACSDCHREANAGGTALVQPTLHVNGKVDFGDGSGACGACHGSGQSAWPKTNAHASHRAPTSAAAVPCESCHVVPTAFGTGTGHPRGGPAIVTFSGRATIGASPSYANGTCNGTYCHAPASPQWTDLSGKAKTCGACHAIPPPAPHLQNPSCETCHSPVVENTASGPRIATPDRHVDGNLDRGL